MTSPSRINIAELIDNTNINRSQFAVFMLCTACLMMDGFDVQALSYVAPALVQDFKITAAALGPVFAATNFGFLIGSLVFSMLADEMHENPMGTMHGGIVAALVDTAMGCALSSRLGADAGFTTLELKINYVRAITQATGRIYADGTVLHSGGRVATTEARVVDSSGTLYAHATSTCMILRGTR